MKDADERVGIERGYCSREMGQPREVNSSPATTFFAVWRWLARYNSRHGTFLLLVFRFTKGKLSLVPNSWGT